MNEMDSITRIGDVAGFTRPGAPPTRAPAPSAATKVAQALADAASQGAVDPAQLQQLVGEIEGRVQNAQRSLQFSVDENSGSTVVKVIDSQTKEVIRQIPAEEVLSMASRLRTAAGGLLLADTV